MERLTRRRSRQGEHRKPEARLRKEIQFNRKVALNAEMRSIQTEIEHLSA